MNVEMIITLSFPFLLSSSYLTHYWLDGQTESVPSVRFRLHLESTRAPRRSPGGFLPAPGPCASKWSRAQCQSPPV